MTSRRTKSRNFRPENFHLPVLKKALDYGGPRKAEALSLDPLISLREE